MTALNASAHFMKATSLTHVIVRQHKMKSSPLQSPIMVNLLRC